MSFVTQSILTISFLFKRTPESAIDTFSGFVGSRSNDNDVSHFPVFHSVSVSLSVIINVLSQEFLNKTKQTSIGVLPIVSVMDDFVISVLPDVLYLHLGVHRFLTFQALIVRIFFHSVFVLVLMSMSPLISTVLSGISMVVVFPVLSLPV